MPEPRLTIVIPAYNEETRISRMLRAYGAAFAGSATLLVVVNGSTDRTADIVGAFVRGHPQAARMIEIREPVGKGGAIIAGFRAAHTPLIGFVDADGATSPEEYRKLVTALDHDDRLDGVIASRWHPSSVVRMRVSALRKAATAGFRFLTRVMFRMPYHDTQCGAKLFRQRVVERITPETRTRNMAFDVEFLVRARAAGFRIVEVPTIWVDQEDSARLGRPSRLIVESFRMFLSLLAIRLMRYT